MISHLLSLYLVFFLTTLVTLAQGFPSPQNIENARKYSEEMGGMTFLVMVNGTLIHESYANGGTANRIQLLASGTKGFTGLMGVIADRDGLIDLDSSMSDMLTEWASDPQKRKITYRHALTMSTGLKELNDLKGWTDYLGAPVDYEAGTTFVYSGDPNIFGLALQRKLGTEKVADYFNRRLFTPLGIRVEWRGGFEDGNPNISGGAYARANEWIKYGEFVRKMLQGTWDGPPIVDRAGLDIVLTPSATHGAYGFYWWLKKRLPDAEARQIDRNNSNQYSRQILPIVNNPLVPDDFVMARGAYGQCLYVIPSMNLVVVRNAPASAGESYRDSVLLSLLLAQPSSVLGSTDAAPMLFPNPADDELQFPGSAEAEYRIYDVRGEVVAQGFGGTPVSLQTLSSGVYTLFVQEPGRVAGTWRFVKR